MNLDRGLKKSLGDHQKVRSFENSQFYLKILDYDRPLKRVTAIKKRLNQKSLKPSLYSQNPLEYTKDQYLDFYLTFTKNLPKPLPLRKYHLNW